MSVSWELSQEQKDALSRTFLLCPTMQTSEGRRIVLDDLRPDRGNTVDQIAFAADNRTHVGNIVKAFSISGYWQDLIERVLHYDERTIPGASLVILKLELEQRLFDTATVQRIRALLDQATLGSMAVLPIFHKCAESLTLGSTKVTDGPYELLLRLAAFPRQASGFPIRALQFAMGICEFLRPALCRDLRAIVQEVAAQNDASEELRRLATAVVGINSDKVTLVFEMKPKSGGFVLRAFLLDSAGLWSQLATDDSPVSESGARDKFRELVSQAEQISTNLMIEMVLSREMLCEPVDAWPISFGGIDVSVGAYYPVVLRWLNRLHDPKMQPHWKEKWQYVPNHCCQPFWLKQTGEYSPQQLLAKLGNPPSTGAFVSFAYAPPRAGDPLGDALSVALSGGTPVAIWWRECDPDPAIAQKALQAVLTQKSLEELPDVLKNVRNQAEQTNDPKHPGRRLAILFDNHDHRPPQLVG